MINSISNDHIKEVMKLQKNSRHRQKMKRFAIEGWRMIGEVSPESILEIYVLESELGRLYDLSPELMNLATEVSDKVLGAMSTETTPQGVLAVVAMPEQDTNLDYDKKPLIVALEAIQDPGNLGTILRTAEAAGVDMVILSKGTVDLYNPKVVKATMGAIFRMRIVRNVDLTEYLEMIKLEGVSIYAANIEATQYHYGANYKKSTCFLLGNEGKGLTEESAKIATDHIKIPMVSTAESLNVAMAMGILVYEAIRQRLN